MILTLYLMEKDKFPPQEIDLDGYKESFDIDISSEKTATVYLRESGSMADWLVELGKIAISEPPRIITSSVRGIFFLRIKRYWMVATFGHAWQLLNTSPVVRDFGIRCVLNIASSNSLRSIKRNRIADSALQAIEQIPDSDDIARFGMDIEQDLLCGIKAKINPKMAFGQTVVGTASLKIEFDPQKESIHSICTRAFRIYQQQSYLKNFDWFDKIKVERSSALIDKLNEKLARAISLGVKSIVMCTPELNAWDEFDTISYKPRKGKSPLVSEELDVLHWRKSIGIRRITKSVLLDKKIYAYKADSPTVISSWPVFNCLHATLRHGSNLYTISNGSWFRIEKSFAERIDSSIQAIPVERYKLPKQSRNNQLKLEIEGEYNLRISRDFSSRYSLMDKNLVTIAGRSTIEVCDLLRRDGSLICVKPWGGKSASLSHLFQQAIVSAQLLSESADYRKKVRDKVQPDSFKEVWDATSTRNHPKFVLAILRGINKEDLPFFAKVALVNCVRTLKQMRCDVTYSVIPMP